MGDDCETGCNSVTAPGVILGKSVKLLPCVNAPAGFYADHTFISLSRETLSVRSRRKA
ncbi:MAG: hypothetical protein M5R36_20695 [Deltaproteobacteria bacterium]|nr:hypothetical protein [Deltaproteobacteria bacterium]